MSDAVTRTGDAVTCRICRDAIVLSPHAPDDDEAWFRARHKDEPHEPPSMVARSKRR